MRFCERKLYLQWCGEGIVFLEQHLTFGSGVGGYCNTAFNNNNVQYCKNTYIIGL